MAACAVAVAETAAEKLALVAPAATVTVEGTATAELLLARLTTNPPLAAAAFRVTEQASVPAPVMDGFAQETPLSAGRPAPDRLIELEAPEEELLEMMTVPEAGPATAGSN